VYGSLAGDADLCLTFAMVKNASRRHFLRTAPAAAVAGLAFTDAKLLAEAAPPAAFQVFTAAQLADDAKALMAKPGNNNLVTLKETIVVMTTEVAHAAKDFEWHEQRDHIIQILDGSTLYELGGTPKGTHDNAGKAGEYLAPDSDSPTKLTLNKGDMLTIPRGTPHRRTTSGSVTLILISSQGMVM
jgi:mannose-6-phosphate isomerase-like protein (cupin superfamily)